LDNDNDKKDKNKAIDIQPLFSKIFFSPLSLSLSSLIFCSFNTSYGVICSSFIYNFNTSSFYVIVSGGLVLNSLSFIIEYNA
jgi:hypothetical protein